MKLSGEAISPLPSAVVEALEFLHRQTEIESDEQLASTLAAIQEVCLSACRSVACCRPANAACCA